MIIATVIRRFDLELFDTNRERDINVKVGGPAAEPSLQAKGIRVRIITASSNDGASSGHLF